MYSPKVLLEDQPDPADLRAFASGICARAHAVTPRDRAEAIWRYFLTDGRFVKPGFWYHIAGWAYEEPMGEVLDPLKLLNSYGFGLCYQIAPVLAAVYDAAGFEDARVWFLTGHTVTEVFYDGGYHYFDSDMLGYNPVGGGPPKQARVASVHDLERDGNIILGKLGHPEQVDNPWYPADVRAHAMGGLAELFTTTADNSLYPYTRYPQGHSMEFVLRPGERLIRYFRPERDGLFYLPHKFTGSTWLEFPQEIATYHIRTADGPHSQKDGRQWATGRMEYHPTLDDPQAFYPRLNENLRLGDNLSPVDPHRPAQAVIEVRSPYVIIDANFAADVALASGQTLQVETSTDDGRTWAPAAQLRGPHRGPWQGGPGITVRSGHGQRTAVTGGYAYLVRFTFAGEIRDTALATRIQINPRTLPALEAKRNELVYRAGVRESRRTIAVDPSAQARNARYVAEGGQGFWVPASEGPADFVFRVESPDGAALSGFDAGGRFLDLSRGLAPDKFTAEVRKIPSGLVPPEPPAASIAWSTTADGNFHLIWKFDPKLHWKDGQPVDRTLAWPEVDRQVRELAAGTRFVYVRYRIQGMAIDDFRLAAIGLASEPAAELVVTHRWSENGVARQHSERITGGTAERRYAIGIPAGATVVNQALILECPPKKTRQAAAPRLSASAGPQKH